jgi:hypothetical protein
MAQAKSGTALSRRSREKRPREWNYIDNDFKIWARLNPQTDYSFLPVSYLLELAERGKWATTRTLDAACDPYRFLGRRDFIFKSSITWLTDKGIQKLIDEDYLASKPTRVNTTSLPHDAGACIAQAAIELGARKSGVRYIGWTELGAHEN